MNDDGNAGVVEDRVTTETGKSWRLRIRDILRTMFIGVGFVGTAVYMLFMIEGLSARDGGALSEGAAAVVAVTAERVAPEQEGRLVHIAGGTSIETAARDADFELNVNGLCLVRKVEMYQWSEEVESGIRGSSGADPETITQFRYRQEWTERAIDSSRFLKPGAPRNPPMPSVRSHSFYPAGARLGAFGLTNRVLDKLPGAEKFAVPDTVLPLALNMLGQNARVEQGGIYVGADPHHPAIGDVRISWQAVPIRAISVVGRQTGGTITPWLAGNGGEVLLVRSGLVDPALMFRQMQSLLGLVVWVFRFVCVLFMFIGFRLMLWLPSAVVEELPLIGAIVAAGASLFALLCTMVVAPVVIAAAWLFYRPVAAVSVLIVGALFVFGTGQVMMWRLADNARPPSGLPDPAGALPNPAGALPNPAGALPDPAGALPDSGTSAPP